MQRRFCGQSDCIYWNNADLKVTKAWILEKQFLRIEMVCMFYIVEWKREPVSEYKGLADAENEQNKYPFSIVK